MIIWKLEKLATREERSAVLEQCDHLSKRGFDIHKLTIDPLRSGWATPILTDHFRSGCAPIEAIRYASELLANRSKKAVLIEGIDLLKSEYSSEERRNLMRIYNDLSIPAAYNELTEKFLEINCIEPQAFRKFCEKLFNNLSRTIKLDLSEQYRSDRFETKFFKRYDCANPNIDFIGRLLLIKESDIAEILVDKNQSYVQIDHAIIQEASGDGPDHIKEIARFEHLNFISKKISNKLGRSLKSAIENGTLILDVYTCFPIVPLAFILNSGLATTLDQASEFIERYPITVSGGMNLARAPWNNPVLNSIISMHDIMLTKRAQFGLVHGNGGLGYKQGLTLLRLATL